MNLFVVRPHDDPSRGNGAFARPGGIKSGELVLDEPPLLLYPQASRAREFCGHCLKYLEEHSKETVTCQWCIAARFCTEGCRAAAAADPGSHTQVACAMMQAACIKDATDDTISALHLLSRLYALLVSARLGDQEALCRYEAFMSLSDGNRATILEDREYLSWLDELCDRIAPVFARIQAGTLVPGLPGMGPAQLPEATPDFVKTVCLKDLVNGYGIRIPRRFESDCGMLRGTALYKEASRVNHECLPNVARCEDFDESTSMRFVALHDLPEGEEVTQSYFPLDWEVSDRQSRCQTVYGFTCTCPRCVLEGGEGSLMTDAFQGMDEGYIAVFVLKYLCVDETCEGTMVPVLGAADETQVCNVCGCARGKAEFLSSLGE